VQEFRPPFAQYYFRSKCFTRIALISARRVLCKFARSKPPFPVTMLVYSTRSEPALCPGLLWQTGNVIEQTLLPMTSWTRSEIT
jgi:hypothetical protein